MSRIPGIARVTAMAVIAASLVTVSVAQPPERPEGPPERGGSFERPGGGREGQGPGGREGRMGPGGGGTGGPPPRR